MTNDLLHLAAGELTMVRSVVEASNAAFYCEIGAHERAIGCIYKPIVGEEPLWDFPDGTLAGREVAAFLVSRALGWKCIPPTVMREGPSGLGSVQLWIGDPPDIYDATVEEGLTSDPHTDVIVICRVEEIPADFIPIVAGRNEAGQPVVLAHSSDPRLLKIAILDVLINNADRKAGHVLRSPQGGLYGIDHGICLHTDDKLRTVLWGWAGETIDDQSILTDLRQLATDLTTDDSSLAAELAVLITPSEIEALAHRVTQFAANPIMPLPLGPHPLPWPLF